MSQSDVDQELVDAARAGWHEECVRLLFPVSRPLCEIEGLLDGVIEAGSAKGAALLIAEEPRLLDGVDLSKCLAAARENGHGDLASYLSSIIGQKAIRPEALGQQDFDAARCLQSNRSVIESFEKWRERVMSSSPIMGI